MNGQAVDRPPRMSSTLAEVVPWGRSFDEYVAMFRLEDEDLSRPILGCGDGPASFNAVATERGCDVVSADPLYAFSVDEIRARIAEATPKIIREVERNRNGFVWSHFRSVEDLIATRVRAMEAFLADLPSGIDSGRYVEAALPSLPFQDNSFEMALCSHFLFLYSEQLSFGFHVDSIVDLCRVSQEVRIFPLLELGSARSRHLDAVIDAVRDRGLSPEIVAVPYEFQVGGNQMLRVRVG